MRKEPAEHCQHCSIAGDPCPISQPRSEMFKLGRNAERVEKLNGKAATECALLLSFPKVYQADAGHFLCKDKYYGRKLSPEGFRQTLQQFLCNGNHLRTDVLEPIILKLKALLSVIKKQSSYRFYSSSLLIIYDGKDSRAEMFVECHSETRLKQMDSSVPESLQDGGSTEPSSPPHPMVDVRMIDFAHSTFKGFRDDPTVHDGPDRGYVFGLESLINIMEQLREGNQ